MIKRSELKEISDSYHAEKQKEVDKHIDGLLAHTEKVTKRIAKYGGYRVHLDVIVQEYMADNYLFDNLTPSEKVRDALKLKLIEDGWIEKEKIAETNEIMWE